MQSPTAAPERRAAWSAFVRRAHVRVTAWLTVLHSEGSLRPGSPERHARLLLAVIDGLAMSVLMPGNRPSTDQLRETIDDAFSAVIITA